MAGALKFRISLFALLVLLGAFSPVRILALPSDQINVLVISSFAKDIPAQIAFEKGLKSAFKSANGSYNLFFEFMDVPRLGSADFPQAFRQYLAAKYGRIKLDFLVGWAYDAVNFIHGQPEVFPAARRIFFEIQGVHDLQLHGNEQVIGVKNDFRASLQEVLRLEHPQHIIVIGTTLDPAARSRLLNFKTVLAELGPDIETEYLLDQPLDRVVERLVAQSRTGTLAFYLLMFSDGRGTNMPPYAVARRLAERSAVPIYSFWESLMGSGIVGGYLISQEVAGHQLGEAMLALHRGEAVGDLSPMLRSYDWASVTKWGIDPSKIPPDALIINRQSDLLERYLWPVVAILSFCALESLLIVFLVINHLKRRKVERELTNHRNRLEELVAERTQELHVLNKTLVANEERLKTLSDAAFEGLLLLENGIIFDVNRALVTMTGYKPDELIGRRATDFVEPANVADVEAKIEEEYTGTYEIKLVGKNGVVFPVKIHARMFSFKERHIHVVAVHDLREQKMAEEEIKTLRGILPICSSCKKIRDDTGYWSLLEEYIESHSEAMFSHGLCAACEEKLYGNQAWFKKKLVQEKN